MRVLFWRKHIQVLQFKNIIMMQGLCLYGEFKSLEHHVIWLSNYQDNFTIYVLSHQPQIDS